MMESECWVHRAVSTDCAKSGSMMTVYSWEINNKKTIRFTRTKYLSMLNDVINPRIASTLQTIDKKSNGIHSVSLKVDLFTLFPLSLSCLFFLFFFCFFFQRD